MAVRCLFGALAVFVVALTAVQAIINTEGTFHEEVVCEVEGRLAGIECGLEECPTAKTSGAACKRKCCPPTPLPLPPDPSHGQRSRKACDQYKPSKNTQGCNYVINENVEARVGEFPYFVALGFKHKNNSSDIRWQCGGGLISENFVLTTAVCALGSPQQGAPAWVLLGSLQPKIDGVPVPTGGTGAGGSSGARGRRPQMISVAEVFVHPAYTRVKQSNDIALLRLAQPASLDASMRPACLYTERAPPVQRVVAAGFGISSNNDGKMGKLNKVDLPIISSDKCKDSFKNMTSVEIDDSRMICAGEVGKDTCLGDSGAPLVVKSGAPSCTYQILGLTSFGATPCGSQRPSIYTRLYSYLPWIESIVWP